MKKIMMFITILLLGLITSCKQKEASLEDYLGKYTYKECVYVNEIFGVTKEDQNKAYRGKARFAFKENSYYFYDGASTKPQIELIGISYQKIDAYDYIEEKSVKKLFSKDSTRFVVSKNNTLQGYSLVIDDGKVFYVESRYLADAQKSIVWKVVRLEKRD